MPALEAVRFEDVLDDPTYAELRDVTNWVLHLVIRIGKEDVENRRALRLTPGFEFSELLAVYECVTRSPEPDHVAPLCSRCPVFHI